MATVYTHINPLQKRAINYFRQRVNEIGERGKIGSELDELLRKQEFFHAFMTSHGDGLRSWEREYIRDQAGEVVTAINSVDAELTTLKSILKSLNPCPDCGGHGELRTIVDHDYSTYAKCEACDGDGVEGGAITAY
ncbi:hypothetical protein LCGC14_2825520 [marine sediment metagenome]|uniref:Uncharacterized protein n=1 Tax=marine sediment metagenome TaxID=412755 RepID=A0A0F9AP34_9ZZZZ